MIAEQIAGKTKHTTAGIRMWSPTILLTCRRVAKLQLVVGWVPPGWEKGERRFSVVWLEWLGWVRNRQGGNGVRIGWVRVSMGDLYLAPFSWAGIEYHWTINLFLKRPVSWQMYIVSISLQILVPRRPTGEAGRCARVHVNVLPSRFACPFYIHQWNRPTPTKDA
jgi:hypothetical protein